MITIEELTRLFANLHDGTPGPHLGHDAAGSPHVNWGTVVPLAKEQLWRTIPQRDHAVRVPVNNAIVFTTQMNNDKTKCLRVIK